MEIQELKENINNIIFEALKEKIKYEDITPDKHLVEELGAESSEVLEIFLTIMAEYDIEINIKEISSFQNLDDIYTYIYKLVEEKNNV
jgi:acyl carrier protein